jgi:hypothetical protein
MTRDVRDLLTGAIEKGDTVRVVYHGGSRPGSIRDVRPLWLTADSLRAHDIAAGIDKTFILSKIEIADSVLPLTPPSDPETVEAAIAPKLAELQALGWHVTLTRDVVRLHAYFKNGKPRKTYSMSLDFSAYTAVGVVDLDDRGEPVEYEERWKSRAPYHVSGLNLPTRSFGNIWKATALFLDEARNRAPRQGGACA